MIAEPEAGRLVCVGEALVDLICPDRLGDSAEARRFEVRFGGALSNVALAARRAGARVALASGAGDDRWGRFIRLRLESEGVELDLHETLPGVATAFAFATLDAQAEPDFEIHGAGIDAAIATLAGRELEVVAGAAAICFGSNTAVDERSLAATRAIRDEARAAGVPLLFDPNLRRGRWRDLDRARSLCRGFAAGAAVLKCNLTEARWLVGGERGTVVELAEELLGLGPELVVVTAGPAALAARGSCTVDLVPPQVEVVSPLGSGDVFMGVLAAGLIADGWNLDRAPQALEDAAAAGAAACTHLGAFE